MEHKKVPVIKVHYKFLNTLVMTVREYNELGRWRGLIKKGIILLREVKCVELTQMNEIDLYSLKEWEP